MPFPSFGAIADPITDHIFDEDVDPNTYIKVKTPTIGGAVVTSKIAVSDLNTKKLSSQAKVKYVHPSGFTLEKLEIKNDGSLITETKLNTVPGLKVEFKGKANKADIEYTFTPTAISQYTFNGKIDVNKFEKSSIGCVGGFGSILAGVNANICLKSKGIESWDTSIGFVAPKYQAHLQSTKTFAETSVLALWNPCKEATMALQAINSAKGVKGSFFTLWKFTPEVSVKVKVESSGAFKLAVKKLLDKKFAMVGAAEVAPNAEMKFGVNVTLG